MKYNVWVFLLASYVLGSAQTPAPSGALKFEPHTLKVFDGREVAAELGRLKVPEKPGSAKTIEIALLRLKGRAAQPGPPIVFLMGGAGRGIVMGQIPPFYQLFDRLRDVGDVLLLDQRGIGMAAPELEGPCNDVRVPVQSDALASASRVAEVQIAAVRGCGEKLRAQGIDFSAFSVAARAGDLEELRRALGAERLSLLAWSAGTEAALETIRKFGPRIHAAVLLGAVGPDHILSLPSTADLQLRKVSALVAADPKFKDVPELFGVVQALLEKLERAPLTLTVTDPVTKSPVQIQVGRIALQTAVQGEMSDGRSLPGLPAWIYALARGDEQIFRQKVERMYNGLRSGSVAGLVLGCERGWTPDRRQRVQREARTAVIGTEDLLLPQACAMLKIAPQEKPGAPVSSPVRALFVSGSIDGAAPPFQAEEIRFGWPNSIHLIVENGTHDVIVIGAVQDAIISFLKGENVSGRAIAFPPTFR